jgi:hypothetical protein
MSNPIYKKNASLIEKRFPSLYIKLEASEVSGNFQVSSSKSGTPTLSFITENNPAKYLHSAYRPENEAEKYINGLPVNEFLNFIVVGSGLGYNLLELTRKISKNSKIILIENNIEIFKLALESLDLSEPLQHPGLSILIAPSVADLNEIITTEAFGLALNGFLPVVHKPSISLFPNFYKDVDGILNKAIQEAEINQKTQSKFSRMFFHNIMENIPAIINSPGVSELKSKMVGTPAVVVSAGPSLDKNIEILKSGAEKIIIIAVSTTLKPLLRAGISPDFVVAIDPDDITVKGFDLKNIPDKPWLLFDPTVPWVIPDSFKNRRLVLDSEVYFSKWIAQNNGSKGNLGKSLSVAHTGLLLAKHLGCSPVVLLGQDLAFFKNRMHCSGAYYQNDFLELARRDITLNLLEKEKYKKYSSSLKETLDIFGQKINTTIALESYKHLFENELAKLSDIINATEGGLPIDGAKAITLKETLVNHCEGKNKKGRIDFLANLKPSSDTVRLKNSMKELFKELNEWLEKLSPLKTGITTGAGNKDKFLNQMEGIYIKLTASPELAQLLQGFSYKEFIDWNQANHKIHASNESPEKIKELKYKRDQDFLPTLWQTCHSMQQTIGIVLSRI